MKEFDVVVIGGGIIGLTFALELSQKKNYSIAIIEPNGCNPVMQNSFHTRVSAITPSSQEYLASINVWDDIKRKRAFVATNVWDQNSHGHLNFNAKDEGLENLGFIIENDSIQSALFHNIDHSKIEIIQEKLEKLSKTDFGYKLSLADKTNLTCRLVIGADGPQSKVRELATIDFSTIDYDQKAVIANIKSEKSLGDSTWQRFLSDSIVAILPLSENQASIVWSCKKHLADELELLEASEFNQSLTEAVEYRFGNLELQSDRKIFPLVARSAQEYTLPNLALIGDAAHSIHPLAGQGANLGFSDARELNSQLLKSYDKPLGDHSILRRYARARRLDNELMAKTMTGLDWIYKENNEPMRWLRGFGMNVINESSTLKSLIQKQVL